VNWRACRGRPSIPVLDTRPPMCLYSNERGSVTHVLWTIAVILLVMWALGLATSYTVSGFIHILLILAIVVVLIRVIQGRRAL
jgi:hypothetical protein